MNNLLFAFFTAFVFFIAGLLTNNHYGISWDEPEHFMRGQAYLQLFLTGKPTYEGMVKYDPFKARSDSNYHERSYYQNDSFNAQNWFVTDTGHPPLNGILASLSNRIFYQFLGWFGDIESYHLFNIFISSILVGTVFFFAAETFGVFAGLFAAILLATYPLFWAESHFNVKDPAQSAFFVLTLYWLWKALEKKNYKFVILASVFAGLAFSVKFNILFMPFVVGPWLLILLVIGKDYRKFVFSRKTLLAFLFFPIIMFGILIAIWPFLWQDVLTNLLKTFLYYKELGTEDNLVRLEPNMYAIRWIIFTTPLLTLISFLIGLSTLKKKIFKYHGALILWILILLIPIMRVSLPGASIYGGVRQIMEYIPGVALIAGVGLDYIRMNLIFLIHRPRLINSLLLSFVMLSLVYPLIKLHPNENVYFNQLIGGLLGAYRANLASAGNSYGNVYWQIVQWLNDNAEQNSKVALIQGTTLNIVTAQLRPDIDFSNDNWSGIYRKGEYLIELIPQGIEKWYPYAWEYVETVLDPVYEVRVDGAVIAKVWKNDFAHTKPQYRKIEGDYQGIVKTTQSENKLTMELSKQTTLTRLNFGYSPNECELDRALIYISSDGKEFIPESEKLPANQVLVPDRKTDYAYFFFAAKKTRFVRIEAQSSNSCFVKNPTLELIELIDE